VLGTIAARGHCSKRDGTAAAKNGRKLGAPPVVGRRSRLRLHARHAGDAGTSRVVSRRARSFPSQTNACWERVLDTKRSHQTQVMRCAPARARSQCPRRSPFERFARTFFFEGRVRSTGYGVRA